MADESVGAAGVRSIPEAFERRVRRTPEAIALRHLGATVTYAELDARANRLAHLLAAHGVGAETPVAVLLERSPRLIVALLAILKAGGGYLAIDPRDPAKRVAATLADSGTTIAVTEPRSADRLPAAVRRILLDGDDPADLDAFPAVRPQVPILPENIAYTAYTSGSTGAPKGVGVPHAAVLRLVLDADFLRLGPGDVFLQHAPVAFDASTLEIWAPLLNGAGLAVAEPGEADLPGLARQIRDGDVTVLWLTAGLFHQMVESQLDSLRGLRYLIAGGDVLTVPTVARAVAGLPDTTVVNGYGPTENTTFTCCYPVRGALTAGTVPIGFPIRGTTVRILDDTLRPVPDGETGELYAGGLGVARGYLNRAALSAERFVADPSSTVPGARLYRTGDLARRGPDGAIEFAGRADAQVKIRGFRVEPAEVEAALARATGLAEVAVVAQRQERGGHRLAAFYRSETALATSELRDRLAAEVPGYLVPSSFTRLDALPLTKNGKVDRAALADRVIRRRPELDSVFRAPAEPMQARLADLWADVLELDEVGIDDDFFELGGHSLIATRITGAVAEEYEIFISAQTFYENPTVAELAVRIDERRREDV